MATRLKLYYPCKPYLKGQGFGENRACSYPDTTGVVSQLPNGTCPAGKTKLYTLLGMKGHTGLDLGASNGQPIYSSISGTVWRVGEEDPHRGLGVDVISDEPFLWDEDPLASFDGGIFYAKIRDFHMKSFAVKNGQKVSIGTLLGYADNTGLSSGDHNHKECKPVVPNIGWFSTTYINVVQENGFFGSVNPDPYWTGIYAQDYSTDDFTYIFNRDLWYGLYNPEVKKLQEALQFLGFFPTSQELTNYYGPITKTAVKKFQKYYNIVIPLEILGYGRFGPKTRGMLNTLIAPI